MIPTEKEFRNIKLIIEYDGAPFNGFQKQTNPKLLTVQGFLERILSRVAGEEIRSVTAGRTDAGVHALHQVITFKTHSNKSPEEFRKAVNALAVNKIAVLEASEVPLRYHARFTATSRTYRYFILNRPEKPCIGLDYIYHYKKKLDLALMREGAEYFVGEKDFLGFSSSIKETEVSIRKVYSVEIYSGREYLERYGDFEIPVRGSWIKDLVVLEFCASGFLRSMARMMCAMLVRIGSGRAAPDEVLKILEQRNPSLLPAAVPANALFLCDVTYDSRD